MKTCLKLTILVVLMLLCALNLNAQDEEAEKPKEKPKHTITAEVFDKATGERIENATFILGWINPHHADDIHTFGISDERLRKDGDKYIIVCEQAKAKMFIIAEAIGYKPSKSDTFTSEKKDFDLKFELDKGEIVTGKVFSKDKKPLEGAIVTRVDFGDQVFVSLNSRSSSKEVNTKKDGSFIFSHPNKIFGVLVTHEEGYAIIDVEQVKTDMIKEIVLTPWAHIKGRLMMDGKPLANHSVNFDLDSDFEYVSGASMQGVIIGFGNTSHKTDENGYFEIKHATTGKGQMICFTPYNGESAFYERYLFQAPVTIHSGMNEVEFSNSHSRVKGRVQHPMFVGIPDNWRFHMGYASLKSLHEKARPPYPYPSDYAAMTMDEKNIWLRKFTKTEKYAYWEAEWRKRQKHYPKYEFKIEKDGSFDVINVEPGEYELDIYFSLPRNETAITNVSSASYRQQITVVAEAKTIDLGVCYLQPVYRNRSTKGPKPVIGQPAPDCHFYVIDPQKPETYEELSKMKLAKLSDYKGKFVLLEFWRTSYGPCRALTPKLNEVYDKLKGENFVIVSHSSDRDINDLVDYAKQNNMQYVIGWKNAWANPSASNVFGVSKIPANYLISPDGVLLEVNLTGEELYTRVQQYIEEAKMKEK
ncbi:TlpA family protein disulfide reductase [Planctomycetota bacterium]|nr:TlpA family protein disulfide reductase [Planctomycetota bacterium]